MLLDVSAVVSGVGQTAYTYESGRTESSLAMEAIVGACVDASIDPKAIDGIITHPYSISAEEIYSSLGLKSLRFSSTVHMGGAGAVASLRHAVMALSTGAASNVLIIRSRNGASGARINARPPQQPAQHFRRQLEVPYGWNVPAQRYSMICRRYMHEYSLTRRQLGSVIVSASRHAQLNPGAQRFGHPIDMEKYLSGRVVAAPYTRYDCCLDTDGACAVILARRDRLGSSRRFEAEVVAVGEGRPDSPDDLTNRPDILQIGLSQAAAIAWESASRGPADMDAAMIYDCFTFEVIHQLEAAGFAGIGEGGTFCERGEIDLGGSLPVNTHGGLLAEGHTSGLGHVVEAVRQIRGHCGPRQVPNARNIAVTGWGDLGDGAVAVLARTNGRTL